MNAKLFRPTQIALLCACLGAISQATATTLTLAQQPLYGLKDLPPNLFLTLDDSGSMAWAYVPDSPTFGFTSRRFRAADANPLAYNPLVEYKAPYMADGINTFTTTFNQAWVNGYNHSAGWVDLSTSYKATTEYIPGSGHTRANHPSADFPGTTASANAPAYYYVRDNSASGCPSATADDDRCYRKVDVTSASGTGPVGADERQNFANWYSFYRTRNLAVMSAAAIAFSTLPGEVRITWQAINKCQGFTSGSCNSYDSGVTVDNKLRTFKDDSSTGMQRTNFYNWLARLPAAGSTPLRKAFRKVGLLMNTTGANSPYGEFPNRGTSGTEYSCRSNYAVLLTDGLWNSDTNTDTGLGGDTDSVASRTLHQPSKDPHQSYIPYPNPSYSAIGPYRDAPSYTSSYTLADMAFEYWATDFRPGAGVTDKNDVPVWYPERSGATANDNFWNPKNDPASWQHVVTFTIGVGLEKTLQGTGPTWTNDMYSVGATTAWPVPSSNSANNISDLWHAAINSRGQFFSAQKPNDIINAFTAILSRVQANDGSASAVATSSGSLSSSTATYQASYEPKGWVGDLKKFALNASGALITPPAWSAADQLNPAINTGFNPTNRVVISATGGANSAGIPFTWAAITPSQQSDLDGGDSRGPDRLNWIRGDGSKEGPNPTTDLRQRATTKLGDIINSDPQYVGTPSSNIGDPSYLDFMLDNCTTASIGGCSSSSRKPVIYVGANDGMLHGFDDSDHGKEILAFVPSEIYGKLKDLSTPGYTHKMFVDGSPQAGDAYLQGAWRTLLLGGLGAGGKGVYALNVTNPTAFAQTTAAIATGPGRIVQWELTSADADAGHVYGKARVVKLEDDKWYAIFGNGYNSSSGKSTLFLVDLDDAAGASNLGSHYMKITAPAGSGLSSVLPVDVDGNGKVDYVYGGDIDGNLWRFDLHDGSTSNWKVDSAPLFVATDDGTPTPQRQPITTMPQAVRHPMGGMFIVFGTGSSLQAADVGSTQLQRIYGIWDTSDLTPASDWPNPTFTLSQLEKRKFAPDPNHPTDTTKRSIVDDDGTDRAWYSPSYTAGKLGWYVNLTASERIAGDPQLVLDRILVTSNIPNASDPCTADTASWVTVIDPLTGLSGQSNKVDGLIKTMRLLVTPEQGYEQASTTASVPNTRGFYGGGASTQPASMDFSVPSGRVRQGWRMITE